MNCSGPTALDSSPEVEMDKSGVGSGKKNPNEGPINC